MAGSGPFASDEKCQDFVGNLVRLRGKFGWTQPQLAAACHFSPAVISNIESFQRAPLLEHGEAIDSAFGLTGMFAAKAWSIQSGAYPDAFKAFPAHEAAAHDIYIYEHSVFPGLIQTERYARAVIAAWPNIVPEEIDRLLAGRLARQKILTREEPAPPRIWALVDEAVLRRPVDDAAVMHEQCMHALEVAKLPHVSLAVVPQAARWHVGLLGSCHILEREGIPRVVNLEDLADGRVSEDPVLVRRTALRFRTLQHEALPGRASREIIARLAEELWNSPASPDGARALSAAATAGRA
ncbi:MAG: helix-turn-helix transcriptional regulator [Streptosporangiales bacterium]|nr:helix-turn-helix transcriptional regulator [Streptosporangiales bacterium]